MNETAVAYQHILIEIADRIATVTMNRPEKRNALSIEHMNELTACLRVIGEAREAAVVILRGNGPAFCAGHDLGEMLDRSVAFYRHEFEVCTTLMTTIQTIPQPVIAQVHGIATAAGCQLVATCDLAVAAEEATFATPGGRGGWFCTTPMVAVARAVGAKRALEMLLTGNPIDAPTALAWGLVNRVVPASQLVEETETLARAASRGSTRSKALGKRAFYDTQALEVEAAYAKASEVMATSALTEDGREAMRSFLEKRPGVYPPRR